MERLSSLLQLSLKSITHRRKKKTVFNNRLLNKNSASPWWPSGCLLGLWKVAFTIGSYTPVTAILFWKLLSPRLENSCVYISSTIWVAAAKLAECLLLLTSQLGMLVLIHTKALPLHYSFCLPLSMWVALAALAGLVAHDQRQATGRL